MNSFGKRIYNLLLVLIISIAFVEGLYCLGHEMGPAASVREQYRIFLLQRAEKDAVLRQGLNQPGPRM